MNQLLKPATISDISKIYSLAESIWEVHYVPIIGKEQVDFMLQWMYSEHSLKEQMTQKGHSFYLIQKNNEDIGFISVSKGAEAFIHKFYIHQDFQKEGIGSQVFNQILSILESPKSIRLTVNRKNYKSINFYFKNGFCIEKVEDFDIGNGYFMNDFVMLWTSVQ
jgi:ribosomal protein S18 acetylase RimI-like enzyme